MFLLNSRLGLFTAAPSRGRSFSRSYRAILPSSLAVDHSSTFGYSPRLPVSVYGTGTLRICLEAFLDSLLHITIGSPRGSPYYRPSAPRAHLTTQGLPKGFNVLFRQYADASPLCPSIAPQGSIRILTDSPSTDPFGPSLRSRLTPIRLTLIRKP